ncbi:hypothetical protein JCGZ_03821 [Jatropha curcas]|uniref:Uncharacterized protein n=1 Tax=Jatropha curcas TaxID=180498 RepID=A0A067JD24_JATCU|nr:hypothetical protein JCGZ_03821 [Jatropha curcas]
MAILFLRRQYDSSGTIVTTVTHWKNLPCRFEESSLTIKHALLLHGNALNNSTNIFIPMISMHRRDTDQRRMFSYADFAPGPSSEPGPSTGPPGPLGSEFQDSQSPDTPMTSQQIEALLPRRSARLQQRPSQPGPSSHNDSDYDPEDDHNTWIAGNLK